jgi:hypothetical protein
VERNLQCAPAEADWSLFALLPSRLNQPVSKEFGHMVIDGKTVVRIDDF